MEDTTAALDGENLAIGNYNKTKLIADDPFKLEAEHKNELIERTWLVDN